MSVHPDYFDLLKDDDDVELCGDKWEEILDERDEMADGCSSCCEDEEEGEGEMSPEAIEKLCK